MHIYFSGIGGAGIGPLALIAKQAGYDVSGSDLKESSYIEYLRSEGLNNITIGQTREQIAQTQGRLPIDWFVYSSALPQTHEELLFCQEMGIKQSKRDEFLNQIIKDKNLKLVAIAGTHGKTTTTAMTIWLFKQLGIPISYSVGAKISFGDMGHYEPKGEYFVYEADEFDRNFLSFYPEISMVTGLDWDHPDIYPTRGEYNQAFKDFLGQSKQAVLWKEDVELLGLDSSPDYTVLISDDPVLEQFKLPGLVNRQNAWQVVATVQKITGQDQQKLIDGMNKFPGVSRRFEQIAPNIYSDYAHTPPKVRGSLQLAREVAGDNVVVVYEGLHNTRQHFIKDELTTLFDDVKQLYIVPSYLAREDPNLPILSPGELLDLLSNSAKSHSQAAGLNDELAENIRKHAADGDLVLCLSAGGGGSLDEWLRANFKT